MRKTKIENAFGLLVAICVVATLVIFLIEIFVPLSEHTRHDLHLIDKGLIGIFLGDLFYSFCRTFDKRMFLRKNWLLILSFMPFFRIIEIAKARKMIEAVRLFKHRHELEALESVGLKGIHHQTERIDNVVNGLKTKVKDWGIINGKHVTVNLFISPSADVTVSEGIVEGITLFLRKKARVKPHIQKHDFVKAHVVEQQAVKSHYISAEWLMHEYTDKLYMHGINVIITDNEVNFDGALTEFSHFKNVDKHSSYYMFSTHDLRKQAVRYAYDLPHQKEHRGFIVGYNTLVKRYEYNFLKRQCTEQFCIHSDVKRNNLDLYSFMYFMNRRKPLCDAHAV